MKCEALFKASCRLLDSLWAILIYTVHSSSNLRMYGILRSIQMTLHRAPYVQISDGISFEDVLGRPKVLPYEFFRHFEVSLDSIQD